MIQAGGAPAAALRALPASDGDSGVAGARRLPQRRRRAKGGDWRPSLYMTVRDVILLSSVSLQGKEGVAVKGCLGHYKHETI